MAVKPLPPRHATEHIGDKVVISIPARRYWLTAVFGAWLIVVLLAGVIMLGVLVFSGPKSQAPTLLLAAIGLAWTVFGAVGIWVQASRLFGREVVEVTGRSLSIVQVALGLRTARREYLADHIKALRVSSSNMDFAHPLLIYYSLYYLWHHNMGPLAFDYGAGTFRFGSGVDEAEAKQILSEILEKYPQYKN
jgi:hypothetical protein